MENKQTKQSELNVIKTFENKQTGLYQATVIANLYGIFDGIDITLNGAAAKSLSERQIVIYDSHNTNSISSILAKTENAYEVERDWLLKNAPAIVAKYDSLGIKGKGCTGALVLELSFSPTIPASKEAYDKLAAGWFNGFSIGYYARNFKHQTVTLNNGSTVDARLLSDILVIETSLTGIPMNEGSQAINVRSANNGKRQKGLHKINQIIADLDKQAAVKNIDRNKRIREIGLMETEILLQELENA